MGRTVDGLDPRELTGWIDSLGDANGRGTERQITAAFGVILCPHSNPYRERGTHTPDLRHAHGGAEGFLMSGACT
jgi:hypothetical protein